MSQLRISDDALRNALRPGPEVVAPFDFSRSVADAISGLPQQRSPWPLGTRSQRQLLLVGQLLLLLALLLAVIIGAVFIGSLRDRPLGGSQLVVAEDGQLQMIDASTGQLTRILDLPADALGVSRSPGGGYVSFWSGTPPDVLEIVRADGSDRRQLATNLTPEPIYQQGIDVWTADDRYLLSGVKAGGAARILVVDVVSGEGSLIGPRGADSPLVAPSGAWVAFAHGAAKRTLGAMRLDGSEAHDVNAARIAGLSGPDNWSPDSRWVYFDANLRVMRADIEDGTVEQLTFSHMAAAPALSPDGSQIAYMVWTLGQPAIWLMDADGSSPHQLIKGGDNRGWTADGRYVLAALPSTDSAADLVAVDPSTGDRRTLLHVDNCGDQCLHSLGSGIPRP